MSHDIRIILLRFSHSIHDSQDCRFFSIGRGGGGGGGGGGWVGGVCVRVGVGGERWEREGGRIIPHLSRGWDVGIGPGSCRNRCMNMRICSRYQPTSLSLFTLASRLCSCLVSCQRCKHPYSGSQDLALLPSNLGICHVDVIPKRGVMCVDFSH